MKRGQKMANPYKAVALINSASSLNKILQIALSFLFGIAVAILGILDFVGVIDLMYRDIGAWCLLVWGGLAVFAAGFNFLIWGLAGRFFNNVFNID